MNTKIKKQEFCANIKIFSVVILLFCNILATKSMAFGPIGPPPPTNKNQQHLLPFNNPKTSYNSFGFTSSLIPTIRPVDIFGSASSLIPTMSPVDIEGIRESLTEYNSLSPVEQKKISTALHVKVADTKVDPVRKNHFPYSYSQDIERFGMQVRTSDLEDLEENITEYSSLLPVEQKDFSILDIKIGPDIVSSNDNFLYSILTLKNGEKYIGLPSYDGLNTISLLEGETVENDIDYDQLKMIVCKSIEKAATIRIPAAFVVKEGYSLNSDLCNQYEGLAKNIEAKWFRGSELGFDIYYSDTLNGRIQCLSFNRLSCVRFSTSLDSNSLVIGDPTVFALFSEKNSQEVKQYFNTYDIIQLIVRDNFAGNIYLPSTTTDGRMLIVKSYIDSPINLHFNNHSVQVNNDETYSLIHLKGYWLNPLNNINNYRNVMLKAKPVVCEKPRYQRPSYGYPSRPTNTWCSKLRNAGKTFHSQNIEIMEKHKKQVLLDLFDYRTDFRLFEIEKKFYPKISKLIYRTNKKEDEIDDQCYVELNFGLFEVTVPNPSLASIILCKRLRKLRDDLNNEIDALTDELKAEKRYFRVSMNETKSIKLHKLHEEWAGDSSRYATLLKEESKSIDDLKKIKEYYRKTAGEKNQEYLQALEQYKHDSKFSTFLQEGAESLPFVGPEIRNIVNYVEDPSDKNLRRMILGTVGPVGEAVEGAIELKNEGLGMDPHTLRFLKDALTDLRHDNFGKVLEDIVSDLINDLGDEAIESIRHSGLWTDNPGDDPPLKLNYEDVVDIRAQFDHYPYDPHENSTLFRKKFIKPNFSTSVESIFAEVPSLRSLKKYDKNSIFPELKKLALLRVDVYTKVLIQLLKGNASLPSLPDIEKIKLSLVDADEFMKPLIFEEHLKAIFTHSFGKNYAGIVKHSVNPMHRDATIDDVNDLLHDVLTSKLFSQQRLPYLVDSSVIGHRPAGFLYDEDHAVILLNQDLLGGGAGPSSEPDMEKFYLEELGHMLNWWRCKAFEVAIIYCETHGDSGARFRDAVLLDPSLYEGESYVNLLSKLSAHPEVDKTAVKFRGNKLGVLEGWPDYYTMNQHITGGGLFYWLMRAGVNVAGEYPMVNNAFDLEVSITAPTLTKKGNPWKAVKTCKGTKSKNGLVDTTNNLTYDNSPNNITCTCENDEQTHCNVPTMWVTISFRDALDLSVAQAPKFKDSKFAKSGFDISPSLVRKHGGKLPFQLESVHSTDWKHQGDYNIYYKKFLAMLGAQMNFGDLTRSMKGVNHVHQPGLSLGTAPVAGGYLVEIATRDTGDFVGWLTADITSAVGGCAAGFAIGVVTGQDPVTICHSFSDLVEGLETALQSLDKRPTSFFEVDASVTIPSFEYKTAASKTEEETAADVHTSSEPPPEQETGEHIFNTADKSELPNGETEDQELSVDLTSEPDEPGTGDEPEDIYTTSETPREQGTEEQTVSMDFSEEKTAKIGMRNRLKTGFKKIGSRISPIASFDMRIGFVYNHHIVHKGAYNLPPVIVSDK